MNRRLTPAIVLGIALLTSSWAISTADESLTTQDLEDVILERAMATSSPVTALPSLVILPASPEQPQPSALSCTASCESLEHQTGSEKPIDGATECWGNFHWWCRTPEPANYTRFMGLKCEGHFKAMPIHAPKEQSASATQKPEPPTAKRILICEGGYKWIRGSVSTCPATGDSWKKVSGSWTVGSTMSIMSGGHVRQQAVDIPPEYQAFWYSGAMPSDVAVDVLNDLTSAGQAPWFVDIESRSEGMSGSWRVTRSNSSSHPNQAVQEEQQLLASFDAAYAAFQEDSDTGPHGFPGLFLPSLPPPPPPPPTPQGRHMGPGPKGPHPHGPCHGKGPDVDMTCNGKPAWVHGGFPCWGNFTVHHEGSYPPSPDPSNSAMPMGQMDGMHGDMGSMLARMGEHMDGDMPGHMGKHMDGSEMGHMPHHHDMDEDHHHDMEHMGSHMGDHREEHMGGHMRGMGHVRKLLASGATASAATHTISSDHSSSSSSSSAMAQHMGAMIGGAVNTTMTATCKGLWTGALGSWCLGLTTAHSGHTADTWSMAKWDICTGRHKVSFKGSRDHSSFGMATFCKGRHTTSLKLAGTA